MTQSEIYPGLTKIFQDTLGGDLVLTSEMTAQDIDGWDSFAHIRVSLACESEFGVKFTPRDLERMNSVGDFANFIEQHTTAP